MQEEIKELNRRLKESYNVIQELHDRFLLNSNTEEETDAAVLEEEREYSKNIAHSSWNYII